MFSLTRLPVTQQIFILFHKDYFYTQNMFVTLCSEIHRKEVTTTQTEIPNSLHNVQRNMSKVFYIFIFYILRLFLKYIFENTSTECVGFSVTPGGTMAALLCSAKTHSESPHLSSYAMWSFTLIFQNKSRKLCLKTVDNLGKPEKKESGLYPFKWRIGMQRYRRVSK